MEDIIDTGTTLARLVPYLRGKGALSVSVCAFLDKTARRIVPLELPSGGKFYRGFEVRILISFDVLIHKNLGMSINFSMIVIHALSCKLVLHVKSLIVLYCLKSDCVLFYIEAKTSIFNVQI